jgi:predicted RND superfamily exporter protein
MWTKVAEAIIKHRFWVLLFIALTTAYMGYVARGIEMSFDYLKILPTGDPDLEYLNNFKKTFGEDGNIVVVGLKDKSVFQLDKFKKYKQLADDIAAIKGVNDVLSISRVKSLEKDSLEKRFIQVPIFPQSINSQSHLDSLLAKYNATKIYEDQLVNRRNKSILFAISINKKVLNTPERIVLVYKIIHACEKFSKETDIKLHLAGIPYIRSVMAKEVSAELKVFLVLSIIISAIVLLSFFRSAQAVIVPLILVGIVVTWTMGSIVLFGYKISLLTGLIPSLIVITGIPNFVYLFNKYHQEFRKDGDKDKAIASIIKSIGFVTFMTNATTAVGFLVLCNNDVSLLKEFGIVAGLNIMVAFLISMVFIPAVLAYLPAPSAKDLKHLDFNFLNKTLILLERITLHHSRKVYALSIIAVIVSVVGIYKIKSISFMLDDIPTKLTLRPDLAFFEDNFKGIMPLEFVIDTKKEKGVNKLSTLRKIAEFEEFLYSQPNVSRPLSINTFLKGARQTYFDGDTSQYSMPNSQEAPFILRYLRNQKSKDQGMLRAFVDSTGRYIRVSCKVADIGSLKLDTLINQTIQPKIKEIFGDTDLEVKTTGTTSLYMKGNNMLIQSLNGSIFQSILFCTALMAILFSSFRMIVISLVPNIIPLLITAAIMGYFGIPLKPSTAIIFSIVFGITVDNTIHYLAKYRYEIFHKKASIKDAVLLSIKETGASQIYTSIVLFFGFIIYVASNFGGTIALGLLTSITLFTALVINLTLLPCLVMSFDRGRKEKDFDSFLEHYEDFYYESDDEDIDGKRLVLNFARVDNE